MVPNSLRPLPSPASPTERDLPERRCATATQRTEAEEELRAKEKVRNRFASDPGYQHPGHIDVLVPPPPLSSRDAENARRDASAGGLRRPLAATCGYDIERCDRERCVQIDAAGPARDSSKKRKRQDRKCVDLTCDEGYDYSCRRHEASWRAFRRYVEKCIPVKIQDATLFREMSLSDAGQRRDKWCGNYNIKANGDKDIVPILSSDLFSLPPAILDTTVTVQCAFPPPSIRNGDEDKGYLHCPSTPQEIDKAISFSNSSVASCNVPTFMGQEDQITTQMTLREAIAWGGGNDASDKCENDAMKFSTPSMAVCVAQESILTAESLSTPSAKGPHESSSDGECNKTVQILADGKIKQSAQNFPSRDDTPMAKLSNFLCLPSHLLLGDPGETDEEGSDHCNSSTVIHSVNLWYAPQPCCTNVHYDERDNILLVAGGRKVVELCPPGCVRGSGIHSDHANHPALLRRGRRGGGPDVERAIRAEIEATRDLKRRRTHVVSVGAGEGLYIPAGWWHRVESSSATVAINVWFDAGRGRGLGPRALRSNAPDHMAPFRLRHSARRYFEMHGDRATDAALEQLRRHAIGGTRRPTFSEAEWTQLKGTVSPPSVPTRERPSLGDDFIKRWAHFVEQVDADANAGKGSVRDIVDRFRMEMERFLLTIELTNDGHVRGLVRMWTRFPPTAAPTICATASASGELFSSLVLGFSPAACFIMTQAWERHATSAKCEKEVLEVESSYRQFFGLAGNKNEKRVRSHLLDGVEDFRCRVCRSYLVEGMVLGII